MSTIALVNKADPNSGMSSAEATAAADAFRSFFTSIAAALPDVVQISWDGELAVYDEVTGQLQGLVGYTQPAEVAGTGSTGYSAPVGGMVTWQTDAAVRGRILKGRTYLVPLQKDVFNTSGVIVAATVTTIQNAADGVIAASDAGLEWQLACWQRPWEGDADRPAYPGITEYVHSATVSNFPAVLRSRRD